MQVGYGDAGAVGGDGACAVCHVAGGSDCSDHRTRVAANVAEVAVLANGEGAESGGGAIDAGAARGGISCAGSSVGR